MNPPAIDSLILWLDANDPWDTGILLGNRHKMDVWINRADTIKKGINKIEYTIEILNREIE